MASFFITFIFLPHCWQALMQWPIIDQHPVEQTAFPREIKDLVTMDINPSLQILGWYIKGTGLG